ncbi:hypothetical protein ABW20_dc0106489 [Dactylellina cionopaga]|nr:hypothetical protein ABW20_dc0106489 [Dactylellina cionopaga]
MRSLITQAYYAFLQYSIINKVAYAQDYISYPGVIPIQYSTIIQYVTVTPTVTALLNERQSGCVQQPLSFCSDISTAWLSTPTTSPDENFAIEVRPLVQVPDVRDTQYLVIAGQHVLLYTGEHVPGWFLDGEGNLLFDNTGIRLGIAPVDFPKSERSEDGNDEYDTVVAGIPYANSGRNLTQWAPVRYNASDPKQLLLQVLDQFKNPSKVTFMECKEWIPEYNTNAWLLEATFDYQRFIQSNPLAQSELQNCQQVELLVVTSSISVSTKAASHTSHCITTEASPKFAPTSTLPTTVSTPTPTWNSFPIRVDMSQQKRRDSQPNYYILEDNSTALLYIGRSDNPPYFFYNMTRYLVSESSGEELEVEVSAQNSSSIGQTINRFEVIANGAIYLLDEDTILNVAYIGCPEQNDKYSFGAVYNTTAYLSLYPSCQVVSLAAELDTPPSSTTVISTTVRSTTTPVSTITVQDPNITGCNSLNYTVAYSTTGLMNAFATACFCWSYLAETVSRTTTLDCTATILDIFPSITSISVTGVLSPADPRAKMYNVSEGPLLTTLHALVPRNSTQPVAELTVIPTPTDFASEITASPSYVRDSCMSIFDQNSLSTLTITDLSVISDTIATTKVTETMVQTVCYEVRYESAISMTTPVIVACPSSVTA